VAKMLYGLFDLIDAGRITPSTTVVAVITGPAMTGPATPSARTS